MLGRNRFVMVVVATLITAIGGAWADDVSELPFGMTTSHLNLVFGASDADAVHEFYGEILGLKRIPDLNFPGNDFMIRYMGGESELKFIVSDKERPKGEGGTRVARGIRLLALLLPESESVGILERLVASGREMPEFTSGEGDGYSYRYGMAYDGDGNQVEIVFLSEGAPKEKFEQIQIGLSVSDMAAADAFISDIMGWQAYVTEGDIHRYTMGKSLVKFWEVDGDLPAWNGSPLSTNGMLLVQSLVPDVDAVRTKVLERGGKIHTEPFALGKMATIMFVEGPDGILFEFAGPLLARLR